MNVKNKNVLKGSRFCITGKIEQFKNRKEAENFIKQFGGIVTQTVSPNTDYLVYGSQTAKNIKDGKSNNERLAKEHHTSTITFEALLNMISKELNK